MQTSLFLPLILMAGTQSDHSDEAAAPTRAEAAQAEIFHGCRPAVLDPRESSRILFDTRLNALEREYGSGQTARDNLFIARCGDEFVLFSRNLEDPNAGEDALYLRFQEGTFQLVQEHWG